MKKILLLAVLVLFSVSVFGQYTGQARNKKAIKTGFIVMGVGVAITVVGLAMGKDDDQSTVKGIIVIAGVATLVAGILIAAIGSTPKSWNMVGKIETVPQFSHGNLAKKAIPSIGVNISIGR